MNNSENNKETAFEAELYNSLKFYGYLFPENVPQVETFELLYGGQSVDTPLFQDVLSVDNDAPFTDIIDLEIGLAAYSSPDNQFPDLPDEESTDSENNDLS